MHFTRWFSKADRRGAALRPLTFWFLGEGCFSMIQRLLASMFQVVEAAQRAREGILALGVPDTDVVIVSPEPGGPEVRWKELDRFWRRMPEPAPLNNDQRMYIEGIRRGAHLLI